MITIITIDIVDHFPTKQTTIIITNSILLKASVNKNVSLKEICKEKLLSQQK